MRPVAGPTDGVLHWPRQVVTALDLEGVSKELREIVLLPRTVLTPSARDWLKQTGVSHRFENAAAPPQTAAWICAQERPFPAVGAAIASLVREKVGFAEWPERGDDPIVHWVRWLAAAVADGNRSGAVLFCRDAALACCIANKLAGVRGAVVSSSAQTQRALTEMAANWLAVEMPGRTLFEVRQILRLAATAPKHEPSAELGELLHEVERR